MTCCAAHVRFGGKADMTFALRMTAYDPKRTSTVQASQQTSAAKITDTVGRTRKGDAVPKLIEALTVLCHARSVHRELLKLPHVEKKFCTLYATRMNSC